MQQEKKTKEVTGKNIQNNNNHRNLRVFLLELVKYCWQTAVFLINNFHLVGKMHTS